MTKKKEKIVFKKGITRINFPVLNPENFREEIKKAVKLGLPKYRCIGFEALYYQKRGGNHPEFSLFQVFITK